MQTLSEIQTLKKRNQKNINQRRKPAEKRASEKEKRLSMSVECRLLHAHSKNLKEHLSRIVSIARHSNTDKKKSFKIKQFKMQK